MKKPKQPTKKRNPNDSTMRNVQANNKRDTKLRMRVENLEHWLDQANQRIEKLEAQVVKLMAQYLFGG